MSTMKPRSGVVTDGLERAPARGMLRAVGMGDEDWVKPQIGIASSWNEITPCNLSLDRLAKASKQGVIAAGGFPMQFGTISVSDGISMGHEGMHFSLVSREIIAATINCRRSRRSWKRESDCFTNTCHGVCGVHTATSAFARTDCLFDLIDSISSN